MSKRTTFTTISPLPAGTTRDVVVDFLHDHQAMIDLNPLVKERHCIRPPSHAMPEELHCTWYSLTDRISYLPGGLAKGDVTYTCAFNHLPDGVQTRCYAPAGLTIRDKWTLMGSLPGEPVERVELGIAAPARGLYIREDVDMRCSILMTSFVKKTLKKSHAALIERLKLAAQTRSAAQSGSRSGNRVSSSFTTPAHASLSGSDLRRRSWTPSCSVASSPFPVPYHVPQLHGETCTPRQHLSPSYNAVCNDGQGFERVHSCCIPVVPSTPDHRYSAPRFEHEHQELDSRQTPRHGQGPFVPEPLRLPPKKSGGRPVQSGAESKGRGMAARAASPSVRYRTSHPDYPQMDPYAKERALRAPGAPPRRRT